MQELFLNLKTCSSRLKYHKHIQNSQRPMKAEKIGIIIMFPLIGQVEQILNKSFPLSDEIPEN